jgi:hypothetical protein
MLSSEAAQWPTMDCNTSTYSNGKFGMNIREAAVNWQTPHGMSGMDHTGKVGSGGEFAKQVEKWMTPRASAATNGSDSGSANRQKQGLNLGLKDQASQWMTPMVPNGGRHVSAEIVVAKGKTDQGKRTVGLESQSMHWASPTTRMHKGGGNQVTRKDGKSRLDMLDWQAEHFSHPPLITQDGQTSLPPILISPQPLPQVVSVSGGTTRPDLLKRKRLNPAFACWLMGWPWWWTNPALTSFARSEMALYRCRLQQHLCYLLGEPELSEVAA